ncbi:hypothetical protein FRC08_005370 [Ceratobasidium sp. 394]|nr:hypothetical protein FRC08_005370 [Ceratobasidium sp. 394]
MPAVLAAGPTVPANGVSPAPNVDGDSGSGCLDGTASIDVLPGPSSAGVSLDEKAHGLVRPREEDEDAAPDPKRPKADIETLAL